MCTSERGPTMFGTSEKVHHCCDPMHHGRMFFTREERIAHLERYREHLQKELDGVDEYLKEQK